MYRHHKIAVSIPCFNEEEYIQQTISNLPDFVDSIYITDDCSQDRTPEIIRHLADKDPRITSSHNQINRGNGYSVTVGLKLAIKDNIDIVCIVAGDNQCRTDYLPQLIDQVVDSNYDYAKANRLYDHQELQSMPRSRLVGNIVMSLISKFASGYYSINDPLNSFSAIKVATLKRMDLDQIAPRYEFENSLLMHLYLVNASIIDITVPAKYAGEKSDIKIGTYIIRTSKTIIESFIKRIYFKYLLSSFHPIALFYISGLFLLSFGLIYGLFISLKSLGPATASTATVMVAVVPFFIGFQLLLQAIVLDIHAEPKPTSSTSRSGSNP